MIAKPYWITPKLCIIPRPTGGSSLGEEMIALKDAGVGVVVSALQPAEAVELGLEQEQTAAQRAGLQFVNFPISDHSVPRELEKFDGLIARLQQEMEEGRAVGIHCRGCIGRSSVVAATLLIRSGVPAAEAWKLIEARRGSPVPDTPEQREWVERYAANQR